MNATEMGKINTNEWLLTNGLGSFASGTVCDAHTRTYHAWLFAALEPPSRRTLLLARIEATLELPGEHLDLGTNFWASGAIAPTGYKYLQSFQVYPTPTWIWGQSHWQLTRQILMPYGLLAADYGAAQPLFRHRVLVRYRYEGEAAAILKLRPLIGDRTFHAQQRQDNVLEFSQVIQAKRVQLQAKRSRWLGTPWQLTWTNAEYCADAVWYWSFRYPEETQRGLKDIEDLYSPGYLTAMVQPGESLTLEACVLLQTQQSDDLSHDLWLDSHQFDRSLQAAQERFDQQFAHLVVGSFEDAKLRLWQQLLQAGDQFIAYRTSIASPTIIAGYHWFNDWGRDMLISIPGLTLKTKRFALAKQLLKAYGQHCKEGLLPNTFPNDGATPFYHNLDAALWWIETLGLYLETTQDWDFLHDQYPVVQQIYKHLVAGTVFNIRLDAMDGLLTWDAPDVALTWMDTVVDGQPVTPRRGKPIEVNALWYSALCWAKQWAERLQAEKGTTSGKFANQALRYGQQAEQVKLSLQKFWHPHAQYLYDVIAPDDRPDPSIRPNAVIALSLTHCAFEPFIGQAVLQVAENRLLTPYGLRSLDPIDFRYIGRYAGNLWERDRAYHQGTVWSWLLGPFIRAWQRFYPNEPLPINWKPLLHHFQHEACLGSISEIFDGDPPHCPQGAIAQAWSVAELIRHWDDVTLTP